MSNMSQFLWYTDEHELHPVYTTGRRITHVHRRHAQQSDASDAKEHQAQQTVDGEKVLTDIDEEEEIASYDIYEGAIERSF